VDRNEIQKDLASLLNTQVPVVLNNWAKTNQAQMIQVSTDYVFNGNEGPYAETDPTEPLNWYGTTKLKAEKAIASENANALIVRIMVLFGVGQKIRPNFFSWLISHLKSGQKANIVTDQIGNITLASNAAYNIRHLIEQTRSGIYHVSSQDYFSRFDLAKMLADYFDLDAKLIWATKTGTLNQKAKRPLKSGFKTEKIQRVKKIRLFPCKDLIGQYRKQIEQIGFFE